MNQVVLKTLLILTVAIFSASAQSLNPEQTVNPATGEMAFSLPLGSVQGINGHNFPINLYYKAGIRVNDEASPVGLGFSYDVGTITRKEVFVPDDNTGGANSYHRQELNHCDPPVWLKVLNFICAIIAVVLVIIALIFNPPAGSALGVALLVGGLAIGAMQVTASLVAYSGLDFLGGGPHTPSYTGSIDDGKGFFKGGTKDIPDAYFISCPYLSGEMVWDGDAASGHFILKSTNGSATKDKETVTIRRATDDDGYTIFEVLLADGTKLNFDKHDNIPTTQKFWQASSPKNDFNCCAGSIMYYDECVPVSWHLTKVTFSDGNAINFVYDSTYGKRLFKAFQLLEASRAHEDDKSWSRGVMHIVPGRFQNANNWTPQRDVKVFRLKKITTPNESAVFNYIDRYDDQWWESDDGVTPHNKPLPNRLTGIAIVGSDGVSTHRTIQFNNDYILRPKSFNSFLFCSTTFTDQEICPVSFSITNPNAASLTLQSIRIADKNGKKLAPIIFSYVDQNPEAWPLDNTGRIRNSLFEFNGNCGDEFNPKIKYWYLEMRDVWGYYCPNNSNENDFNAKGLKSRACLTGTETPYAAAWSLEKITLPSGMSVKWEYESNRYDKCNGVTVSSDLSGSPRYGGGIRVKRVFTDDGLGRAGSVRSLSYFYTSTDKIFNETSGGCSGYTTCEPYYPLDEEYRTEKSTRGGLYTPTKVAYEMVQAVKNYQESIPYAPYGYTIYKFTHAGDSLVQGFHSNGGKYGDIDSSWKRGTLWRVSQYDRSNHLITQKVNEFGFVDNNVKFEINPTNAIYEDVITEEPVKNTAGWVYLKSSTNMINNIEKKTTYKYAIDDVNSYDFTVENRNKYSKIEPWNGFNQQFIGTVRSCAFTTTKLFGNQDKTDYIGAIGVEQGISPTINYYIRLVIGTDIDELSAASTWPIDNVVNYGINLTFPQEKVIGVGVWRYDENPNPTVLIFYSKTGNPNNTSLVKCLYLEHVHLVSDKWTWDSPSTPKIREINFNGLTQNDIVSCAVGILGFEGAGKQYPDVVFLEGKNGDPGMAVQRHLFRCQNLSNNLADPINLRQSIDFPGVAGNRISIKDAYTDGVARIFPTLEITGTTVAEARQPIHHTLFDHVLVNSLSFDPPQTLPDYFCLGGMNDVVQPTISGSNTDVFYAGMSYQIENNIQKKIFIFLRPIGPDGSPQLKIIKHFQEGVTGDLDGQPNQIWETNSDGKKRVTTPIPAYWKYSDMVKTEGSSHNHMLTQSCQTIVYEKNDASDVTFQDVRSSQVNTWSFASFGTWYPCSTFTWQAAMNGSGVPTSTFVDFPFEDITSRDNSWIFKSSTQYNSIGNLVETIKPLTGTSSIHTSTVYGTAGNLPIGSILNANFKESGVFTCDYNLNEDGTPFGYFDKQNGWEIGMVGGNPTGSVSAASPHFGQYSLHIANGEGLMRNFKVRGDVTYQLSLWAKITSGSMPIRVEYRKETSPITDWPIQYTNPLLTDPSNVTSTPQGSTAGVWKLIKIPVSASSGDDNWIRVSVGFHNTTYDAYIDDVRFAPTNAQVASTYYDQIAQQPILAVDANSNPSRLTEYDGFGRPVKWWKIDKTNPSSKTLIIEKKYVSMGENISILNPVGGETFYKTIPLSIKWSYSRAGATVKISIITPLGTTVIATGIAASAGQYSWTIPAAFGGIPIISNCKIKIEDELAPSDFFDYSKQFTIASNAIFSPLAGSAWSTTTNMSIEWVLAGAANVNVLYYSSASDPSPITITSVANSGRMSCTWNIPITVSSSDQAFIRVVDQANNANHVDSGVITIKKAASFIKRFILNLLEL